VELDITWAVPCGLIVNEIYSNALKYAFIGRKKGTINISMTETDNDIILEIKDDGIGYEQPEDVDNLDPLGLRIIDSLVKQIHATIAVKSSEGTTITITFPK